MLRGERYFACVQQWVLIQSLLARFETKPDFTSQALLRRALELQSEGTIPVLKWVQAGHSMVSSASDRSLPHTCAE